jgi:hypothetical protein
VRISGRRINDPRARTYIVDHVLPGTVIHRRVEVSNTSGALLRPQLYAAAAAVQNGTFGLAPGRTRNELSGGVVTLVAEAYGNRTRRRRWASTSGFEDQEGHQAPSRLHGSP